MLILINKKKNNLKYGIIISITLHIILVFILYFVFVKNHKSIPTLKQDNTIALDITSPTLPQEQIIPSSVYTSQEKLDTIKKVENISDKISSSKNPIIPSSVYTSQEKKKILLNSKKINNTHECNNINIIEQLINNKNISLDTNNNIKTELHDKYSEQKHDIQSYAINEYKKMVIQEINKKFYNDSSYFGKQCILHVELSLDGELTTTKPFEGNLELCQAAISAIKLIKLPIPPNLEIYEIFKHVTLNFSL